MLFVLNSTLSIIPRWLLYWLELSFSKDPRPLMEEVGWMLGAGAPRGLHHNLSHSCLHLGIFEVIFTGDS